MIKLNDLLRITLIGLISGIIGTGTGGVMAFFVNNISNRFLSFILEFSAGAMTAVVCFELLPEAFDIGGNVPTFSGVFIGLISLFFVENYLKKAKFLNKSYKNTGLLRTGIMMAFGIALHNLPEGFAVGSGFEASTQLGITITAIIMLHDIPEGIAVAVPLRAGGISKLRAFTITVLSGLPMGLGAFLGAVLGDISRLLTSVCLGFAGGAMLYVIYCEMVPESKKLYMGRFSSIGNILGIVCGIIVSVYNKI